MGRHKAGGREGRKEGDGGRRRTPSVLIKLFAWFFVAFLYIFRAYSHCMRAILYIRFHVVYENRLVFVIRKEKASLLCRELAAQYLSHKPITLV